MKSLILKNENVCLFIHRSQWAINDMSYTTGFGPGVVRSTGARLVFFKMVYILSIDKKFGRTLLKHIFGVKENFEKDS